MSKKSNSYFEDFITMAGYSCQAAELLLKSLESFNPETLAAQCKRMHELEQAEDKLRHGVMDKLVKEFIPPIDREDIIQLANELDNVTDKIEDILIRMDIYNIRKLRPEALEFARVIVRSCELLQDAMREFPNFRKSATLRQAIINVNSLEEEGDALYIKTMRELHRSGCDVLEIMQWSHLFEMMEECCDACEHVSDAMDFIVLKNS